MNFSNLTKKMNHNSYILINQYNIYQTRLIKLKKNKRGVLLNV